MNVYIRNATWSKIVYEMGDKKQNKHEISKTIKTRESYLNMKGKEKKIDTK